MIVLSPDLMVYPFVTSGLHVLNPDTDARSNTIVVKDARIHLDLARPVTFGSLDLATQFRVVLTCSRAHLLSAPSVLTWIQTAVWRHPCDYVMVHPCTWFLSGHDMLVLRDWVGAVLCEAEIKRTGKAQAILAAQVRTETNRALVDPVVWHMLEPEVVRIARNRANKVT